MRKKEVVIGIGLVFGLFLISLVFASTHTLQITGQEIPATTNPGTNTGGSYPIYTLSSDQLGNGYETGLYLNWGIQFYIENNLHRLNVDAISGTSATFSIYSVKQTITLKIGDEKKLDLNSDGYYDLSLKLNSIINNRANVTIKGLKELINPENVSSTNPVNNEPSVKNNPSQSYLSVNYLVLFVIIAIIIILIIIYFLRRKKSGISYGFKIR